MKAELDSISIQNRMQYLQWTGEPIGEPFPMKAVGLPPHIMELMKDGPPMSMQMRPLFHQMLHHQLERFGIEIVYGQKVVLYWESEEKGKGCVMTNEGDRFEADIVLAADGLHSRSREVALGGQGSGKPSGQSLFRCAVPFEKVMHDPVVKEQLGLDKGGKPMMRGFIGPGTHCMVLTYVDQQGENGTIAWGLNYYVRRLPTFIYSSITYSPLGTRRTIHPRILAQHRHQRRRDLHHGQDEPRLVPRHQSPRPRHSSRPHHPLAPPLARPQSLLALQARARPADRRCCALLHP